MKNRARRATTSAAGNQPVGQTVAEPQETAQDAEVKPTLTVISNDNHTSSKRAKSKSKASVSKEEEAKQAEEEEEISVWETTADIPEGPMLDVSPIEHATLELDELTPDTLMYNNNIPPKPAHAGMGVALIALVILVNLALFWVLKPDIAKEENLKPLAAENSTPQEQGIAVSPEAIDPGALPMDLPPILPATTTQPIEITAPAIPGEASTGVIATQPIVEPTAKQVTPLQPAPTTQPTTPPKDLLSIINKE